MAPRPLWPNSGWIYDLSVGTGVWAFGGGKPRFPTVQARVPGFAQVESEADLTGGLQFAGDVC